MPLCNQNKWLNINDLRRACDWGNEKGANRKSTRRVVFKYDRWRKRVLPVLPRTGARTPPELAAGDSGQVGASPAGRPILSVRRTCRSAEPNET